MPFISAISQFSNAHESLMPNIYWVGCQNVHFDDTHDLWRVSHNSPLMRCVMCISYSFLHLSIPLLIKIEILLLVILSFFRNLKQHMCKQTPPLVFYHDIIINFYMPSTILQCIVTHWQVSLCLRPFFLNLNLEMVIEYLPLKALLYCIEISYFQS